MISPFKVIIPARYASTRLPGKPLLQIAGKSLIQHAYESAKVSKAEQVLIATDDERIREVVESFNAEVIMTSPEHQSGTDRITEVVELLDMSEDTIVVNVQGDEFGLSHSIVDQLAVELINNPAKLMATLCEKITEEKKYSDPHAVKVIFDKNQDAVTFSRSPIPWSDKPYKDMLFQAYLHIGLYTYRAGFLKKYASLPHCSWEREEKLEQLRVLYHGYKIHVEEACVNCGVGVDSEEDLALARSLANNN